MAGKRGGGRGLVSLDDANLALTEASQQDRGNNGALQLITPDPKDDPGHLPDDPDFEAPDMALAEVLASLGETEQRAAKCMVYRIASNLDEEYLYQVTAAEFARQGGLENIRAKYGGGDYRIRVYKDGRILTHKRVKIGAPLIPDHANAPDPNAALRAEVTELKTGLAALIEKMTQRPPEKSLLDQLKEAKELLSILTPENKTPTVSAVSQLKDMKDLLEIARDFAGDADSRGSGFVRLAEKYLPNVLEVIKEAAPRNGAVPVDSAPAVVHAVPSNVAPVAQTPVQSEGGQSVNAAQKMQLKMALGFLVSSAAAGNEPLTYAELAVDKVPAPTLSYFLDRADWLAALAQIDPRVKEHEKWFGLLRAEILQILRAGGVAVATPEAELKTLLEPVTLAEDSTSASAPVIGNFNGVSDNAGSSNPRGDS